MARSKTAEANRLYWESDESVADIAQQLELSRRALYDLIQPLPAGRNCDDCDGPLTYENRSARSSDNAMCEACAAGDDVPAAAQDGLSMDDYPNLRLVGAALAGAALGAALTLVFVPRR
ncbi:MAG TPA: hypothetical protein VMN60_07185 [Longimicrobiales bacterium]|nr:hypothetical protein [Longimicrobiales bacterium]